MSTFYYQPYPLTRQLYSYDMLSNIYQNILNTFNYYQPTYKQTIKKPVQQDIANKLENIRQLEKEIVESLVKADLKQQLYVASKGYVDVNKVPDKDLPGILAKHSNLLGLTSTYNSQVKDLADMLKKINDVLDSTFNLL